MTQPLAENQAPRGGQTIPDAVGYALWHVRYALDRLGPQTHPGVRAHLQGALTQLEATNALLNA